MRNFTAEIRISVEETELWVSIRAAKWKEPLEWHTIALDGILQENLKYLVDVALERLIDNEGPWVEETELVTRRTRRVIVRGQRDWTQVGVPVDIKEFDPHACPACGSQNTRLLSENFDRAYGVTSECNTCNSWWTAMYPLESVYLRIPKTP